MTDRLDVGFVPAECPGAEATGAVRTSTLLVERLSRHHDLTVYVSSQMDASDRDLPAEGRVEYVLHDDLSKLPHPLRNKVDALREEVDALSEHDLVHSYSPAFLPVLADVSAPTVVTLNSYLPVCPKGDMMYHGERKCSGPATVKCATCIPTTSLRRRQGLDEELRAAYTSFGSIGHVDEALSRRDDVSAYHALSPHVREDYAALDFPRDRVAVVPHFYDQRFLAEPRDTPDGRASLLYVGALQDIKGVDVLLRALDRLRGSPWDFELRVAGTGPYEARLRELAARLGVDDRVTWLGYVDYADLPVVYERADAFVYPGRLDEPFGRVLLEALASGTPVVASAVGSTDFIVGDAGVRFEPDDPAALADACTGLLADYDEHLAAIPDQLERFEPETVVGAFLDLYRAVETGTDATGRPPTDSTGSTDERVGRPRHSRIG